MDANTEVAFKSAEMLFKMFNEYSQIEAMLLSAKLTAGASLVVAILTFIGNYVVNVHSKKLDYRDDYYKKIIDKRIDAYEKASQFLTIVGVKTSAKVIEGDDVISSIEYYYYCRNIRELDDLLIKSIEVAKYSTWMSKELDYEFKMINNLMVECMRSMRESVTSNNYSASIEEESNELENDLEKKCVIIACKYSALLDKHIVRAETLIKRDWLNLHKVSEFLKDT